MARARQRPSQPRPHDRQAKDLLRNAQVAVVEVDDPYEKGATITVIRSVRDDPLADMLSRKVIEPHQFRAGREWQRFYETSEIGGARAIDYGREHVDGGVPGTPFSELSALAFQELGRARTILGKVGEALMTEVLGRGLTIGQVCGKWGYGSDRERDYLRLHFRASLDGIAELWGFAGKNKQRG